MHYQTNPRPWDSLNVPPMNRLILPAACFATLAGLVLIAVTATNGNPPAYDPATSVTIVAEDPETAHAAAGASSNPHPAGESVNMNGVEVLGQIGHQPAVAAADDGGGVEPVTEPTTNDGDPVPIVSSTTQAPTDSVTPAPVDHPAGPTGPGGPGANGPTTVSTPTPPPPVDPVVVRTSTTDPDPETTTTEAPTSTTEAAAVVEPDPEPADDDTDEEEEEPPFEVGNPTGPAQPDNTFYEATVTWVCRVEAGNANMARQRVATLDPVDNNDCRLVTTSAEAE